MMGGTRQPMDPAHRLPVTGWRQQTGAGTLTVAVILLLVVGVLVFHSHTASWLEQRATANQSRAKQAHAAAEAGLEAALAVLNADRTANGETPSRATYLSASTTEARKFSINTTPIALTGTPGTGLSYSVTYSLVSPDATPTDRFLLTSNGGSDCSDVYVLESCSGKATVRQMVQLLPSLPALSVYSASAFSTEEVFFERFFGASKAEIKALTAPVTSAASLSTLTSGLVWLEGSPTFTSTGPIGSDTRPVLLVVDGNLTLDAGRVWGFVYVTGQLKCANCEILGAAAVEGNIDTPANVALDTAILDRLGFVAPRFAKVMGTWRDG
jgi:hypothetical protein